MEIKILIIRKQSLKQQEEQQQQTGEHNTKSTSLPHLNNGIFNYTSPERGKTTRYYVMKSEKVRIAQAPENETRRERE